MSDQDVRSLLAKRIEHGLTLAELPDAIGYEASNKYTQVRVWDSQNRAILNHYFDEQFTREQYGTSHTTGAEGVRRYLNHLINQLQGIIGLVNLGVAPLKPSAMASAVQQPDRQLEAAGEKLYRKRRIMLASPTDVSDERDRVHSVVAELNRTGGAADELGIMLEVLDNSTHVSPRPGRPEAVVLDQIPTKGWDVFIGILWTRFGTPTGATNPASNKPFESGTEEEFEAAYAEYQGTGRPIPMFYRCLRSPETLAGFHGERLDQYTKVTKFFDRFKPDRDRPGYYHSYRSVEDFERQVRTDLTRLLREL